MDEQRARELLTAERERLVKIRDDQRAHLAESETESTGELSSFDQHPGDLGTETFEREKDQSILERVEAEIAEVDAAFARLDEGRYGRDVDTGEPIPDERLEERPAARHTVQREAEIEHDSGTSSTGVERGSFRTD